MAKRLVLGCAYALMAVAGCGGGDTTADSGPGTDAPVTPGVDANTDAFVTPGTDTGVDAFVSTVDGGMTDGCELGNTYPSLAFTALHTFDDLPVGFALAPGRDDIFVVLRAGRIVIMDPTTGAVNATPFLDVSGQLGAHPTSMDENGLLGLAFHPDYETNGLFYIAYTALVAGMTATDCTGTHQAYSDRVAVGMRSASSADVGTIGVDIFTVADPEPNHNGGQLGFGPDGYLYYGVGDGGAQGDPCMRGQDTMVDLGKIHRFQVGPGIATYTPAPGNPFISGGGHPTIWAYGLRNPWRFDWDRLTHDMFIADVGQDTWEEVDVLAAGTGSGTNFGWSYCEGTHNFGTHTCSSLSAAVPPIAEYSHGMGTAPDPLMGGSGSGSITGGFVYRGSAIPALRGAYLFADEISSYFAALRHCSGSPVTPVQLADLSNSTCQNPVTFGEDRAGELLVSCLGNERVYRITAH